MKSKLKKALITLPLLALTAFITLFAINQYVIASTHNDIILQANDGTVSSSDLNRLNDFKVDCIMVLGAGVWNHDKPSPILKDRLDLGIQLYKAGVAPKLLMSGDHGRANYDEVNVMKNYALAAGVPSEDIFMDHAGFSTYESAFRAKAIFEVNKMVVVTQKYHSYRAQYLARSLGIDCMGAAATKEYAGSSARELREIAARNKDFFKSIFKPDPTFLGAVIPISGSGDATNDKSASPQK